LATDFFVSLFLLQPQHRLQPSSNITNPIPLYMVT
jgi:hypothetical protein